MDKNIPILDEFSDDGIINEKSYIANHPKCKLAMDQLKKYNIDTALMVFTDELFSDVEYSNKLVEVYSYNTVTIEYKCYIYDNKFLVALSPLGAPSAAGLMEELGFLGITNFFACGSAGLIDGDLDASKFVLVNKAIRCEGTSYHYLPPSLYVETSKETNDFLSKYLSDNHYNYTMANTWTTDGFYRETPSAINLRKQQGAVCVEMECSAWCAVAKYRNYNFSQLLYFSDAVKQSGWKLEPTINQLKTYVIRLMINCVSKYVDEK